MATKIFDRFRKTAASPQEGETAAEEQIREEVSAEEPEREDIKDDGARRREDVELLLSLFPKLNASAVPDEVWDRVREGDSLSAAYCLWLVKTVKEKKRIDGVNSRNAHAALPPVSDDSEREGFFTRDTVRNMSREQIRKNLDRILKSMDSWK